MDWQIRVSLMIFGLALVAFIYYDYSKKKKVQKDNEKLKKQFNKTADGVDSAGFDASGVGKPRSTNQLDGSDFSEKIEPDLSSIDYINRETEQNVPAGSRLEKLADSAEKIIQQEQINKNTVYEEPRVYSLIIQSPKSIFYKGCDFMPLFLSQGLKFGDMNIFHRYKDLGKKPGSTIFSLANAVEPGIFNLDGIDSFETPAFAIFSSFSGQPEYINDYKNLVKTADLLVKELGGSLLDSSGNIYTQEAHKKCIEEINSVIKQNIR